MTGYLAFTVCAAALAALAFTVTVARARRRGVGVVARTIGGRIYMLDTAILDGALFVPSGAPDDDARDLYVFDDRLVTAELVRRYARTVQPTAFVKITGL